jgi:tetratricopeptide (TPR) repeat protein
VSELKSEGNKLFAAKDWSKAIESYESALKLLPGAGSAAAAPERADLLCNKAACLMGLNK